MSLRHAHTGCKATPASAVTRTSRFTLALCVAGLVWALAGCQSAVEDEPEPSAPRAHELVDLRDRVLTYTSGLHPDGPYDPPSASEREQIARGVGHLLDGDAARAERALDPVGLRVTRLTDTGSGRRYDEVAAARDGRAAHWGRLYLTADSAVHWNVQVPHPVSDQNTESLGLRLLEDTPGGSLVLAGAHRRAGRDGSADVAHREDSVFHTVALELQKRDVPALQVHGFARSSDRPYEAILSGGASLGGVGEASALADRMEADGLRVCRGWSARCPLEGTTNVQGRSAQRRHATFLHVELAPQARDDGSESDDTADALEGLLRSWAVGG